MILGIENQTIIGKDDPFGVSFAAFIIDIAFIVYPAFLHWQDLLDICKDISADAAAFADFSQIAFGGFPAHLIGLFLRNEIAGKLVVGMDV